MLIASPDFIHSKTIEQSHTKPSFSIKVTYPMMAKNAHGARVFNAHVKKIIDTKINNFKKGAQHPVMNFKSYINISYKVTVEKKNFVSIKFTNNSYYSGAAHPNSHSFVMNYDTPDEKFINLNALFTNGNQALQSIAHYCIAQLKKRNLGDMNFIKTGAAASAKNYETWNVNAKGLLITFNNYQVAAYVYGPQLVNIPANHFMNLVKQRYKKLWTPSS